MATDLKDLALASQEQVLGAVKTVQDTVLDGVKAWSSAVAKVTPDSIPGLDALPGVDALPSASDALELTFGFAEKVLANQKSFVEALLGTAAAPAGKATTIKTSTTAAK